MAAALEVCEALVAVRAVAVDDVSGERVREGVPVEVVGVLDDELADRQEVALDAVEVARVGRGRDELDVVGVGERPDLGRPVGREVVLDLIDPHPARVAAADLTQEGEVVAAAPARPEPDPEPVGVDVVGAEDVAGAVPAVEGRAWRSGLLRGAQPAPACGRRLIGPI